MVWSAGVLARISMFNGSSSLGGTFLFSYLSQPFAAYHAIDTHDDEGDAQQLTHVEGHTLFEIDLYLLQELNEETEGEDGSQTIAEEETCSYPILHLPVKDEPHNEDDEISDGLVELRGVARSQLTVDKTVVGVEDETPRHVGRTADNL